MHITEQDVIAAAAVLNFVAIILSHVFHNQKFATLAENASKEVTQDAPQIVQAADEIAGVAKDLAQ